MKAAVFHGPRNITTEEVEIPRVGPLEILVKVKATGICGSDLHTYKLGIFPEWSKTIPEGLLMGHEFAGDVVEIGPGVEGIAVGDRVTAVAALGALAEYVLVTPALLNFLVYKLPPEVSYEEAATVEPLATSLHAAKLGAPANGETVVIIGAGIIGLGIVQSLKAMGVDLKRIIVVDVSDFRLEIARKLGATDVVNAGKVDPVEKITELVGTIPFMFQPEILTPAVDVVYDAVGYIKDNPAPPAVDKALAIVREHGRVVLVGAHEAPVMVYLQPAVLKQLKISGSFAYLPDDILESIEYIRAGKLDRQSLVTHTFSLDKAKEAFETQLNTGESVKVIFKT
jgi:2-desacetyl-2-hydroxyethyl bacteriochlorophyllide A dehydrogenase